MGDGKTSKVTEAYMLHKCNYIIKAPSELAWLIVDNRIHCRMRINL